MHTEIICIGSELLIGFVNKNSAYISEKLGTIGLKVSREISVGDDFEELKDVFEEAIKRSNIVIATGGLGPTFDDITREVISEVTNKKLIFNKSVMKSISVHFVRRHYRGKIPKSNDKQAYVLEGAEILQNSIGTAPGQILESNGKIIVLLPGPPGELKPMFEASVLPYLKERFERGILRTKILHTTGLPESFVNDKIKKIVDIERELEGGEISFTILSSPEGVDIKIMASGRDEMLIDKTIKNLKEEFYGILGQGIYGEDNQTLESVVGEIFIRKRKTLAIAESCTGGLVANRITNVPGSSLYFKEAVVTYSDISKKRILGIEEQTLNKYGAVSKEVAYEMAEGIKKNAGTNFGLSITGIAGPKPSSTGKPVGLVYIGLASDKDIIVNQFNFTGTRKDIKTRISNASLDILRKSLI
ncbi:MAG: competence/damage-inducible protein A [Elusimicrobia bacterium]|nr:competence/damage-inducible protein A [Elusimicrobiota bacterium]